MMPDGAFTCAECGALFGLQVHAEGCQGSLGNESAHRWAALRAATMVPVAKTRDSRPLGHGCYWRSRHDGAE